MSAHGGRHGFVKHHSLSLATACVLVVWVTLYARGNPDTAWGSFYGNAVADWMGVMVAVIATKYFYEVGSAESRQPRGHLASRWREMLRDHSLTIFLAVTGAGWLLLSVEIGPQTKWGQVAGNLVSEWLQQIGMILMTKRLIEQRVREHHGRVVAAASASMTPPRRA